MDTPALFDWCEPNYRVVSSIAEFWNTISNIPYIIVGLVTMFSAYKSSIYNRLAICGSLLIIIGIGSCMFHGTLTLAGQMMDELSILYWEISMIYCIYHQSSARLLFGLFILEHFLYWQMFNFPEIGWFLYHPLHASVALGAIYGMYRESIGSPKIQYVLKVGVALFVIAVIVWQMDMQFCNQVQFLQLHSFWHLFSCGGIICLHISLGMIISKRNKKEYFSFGGIQFWQE